MYLNSYDPCRNGKLYLAKQNKESPDEFYIYGEIMDFCYTHGYGDAYVAFEGKTRWNFSEDAGTLVRRATNFPLCRELRENNMLEQLCQMQEAARRSKYPKIKHVIFNDPATIVFWTDGSKTVVKAVDEPFDPEKGLAMAIAKRVLGNQGNYYNKLRKWLPSMEATKNAHHKPITTGSEEKLMDAMTVNELREKLGFDRVEDVSFLGEGGTFDQLIASNPALKDALEILQNDGRG